MKTELPHPGARKAAHQNGAPGFFTRMGHPGSSRIQSTRFLYADGEGFGAGVVEIRSGTPAFEAALQQGQQGCVPVADYEEDQEGDGEVVFVGDGVPDAEAPASSWAGE